MSKRTGAYKSEKRKKELIRQKKQEEKRLKRLKKPEQEHGAEENEGGLDSPPEDSGEAVQDPDISA